jgi:hypothetical protein
MDAGELLWLALALAVPNLAAIPAYLLFDGVCRWPDYLAVPTGSLLWWGLVFSGVGPQSLVHLLEYFAVIAFVIVLLYVRVLFFSELTSRGQLRVSYVMLAIGVLLPLITRLMIPEFPE